MGAVRDMCTLSSESSVSLLSLALSLLLFLCPSPSLSVSPSLYTNHRCLQFILSIESCCTGACFSCFSSLVSDSLETPAMILHQGTGSETTATQGSWAVAVAECHALRLEGQPTPRLMIDLCAWICSTGSLLHVSSKPVARKAS